MPNASTRLTPRQEEVLGLIARGKTNFEIAQALDISLEGAKYHVREIMQRLNVDTREDAVAAWRGERGRSRRAQLANALFAISLGRVAAMGLVLLLVAVGAVTGAMVLRPAGFAGCE